MCQDDFMWRRYKSLFENFTGRLLIFAIASTIIFRGVIFLPDSWKGDREPGASLDGYWRYASAEGCFENKVVLHFKGKVIKVHKDGMSVPFHESARTNMHGGKVILELPAGKNLEDWDVYSLMHFHDYGNRISAFKIVENRLSYSKEEFSSRVKTDPRTYEWVRCSEFDFVSRLKLMYLYPMKDFSSKVGFLACCRFDGHRDRLVHATPASRSKSMGLL